MEASHSTSPGRRVLLLGYFDRGNLGDDAMRDALLTFARYEHPHTRVRCIPLPELRAPSLLQLPSLLRSLRWADVAILAGGTHFHDGLGTRSLRILLTFSLMFVAARALGTSIAFAGIGVGPLHSRLARLLTKLIFAVSSVTLVRDSQSAEVVRSLSSRSKVIEGFDCASLLASAAPARVPRRDSVGISLVPYFASYECSRRGDLASVRSLRFALADWHRDRPSMTVQVFVFYQGRGENDTRISKELAASLAPDIPAELVHCENPGQTLRELATIDALVATRYHAALLGYLVGVPMIIIAYEKKCEVLAEQLGLPREAVLTPRAAADPSTLTATLRLLREEPQRFRSSVPVSLLVQKTFTGLERMAAELSVGRGFSL